MTDDNDELAALKAEQAQLAKRIAELEQPKRPPTMAELDREAAIWRDEMHRASEARMSRASNFSREDLRAMEAACSTRDVQDIVMRDRAPAGPSSEGVIPSSQQVSNVRLGGGGSSGWRNPTPLSNPPGVRILDEILDHQDAVDRHERMVEEARRQAVLKAAESKP
jgi:hypothetical protein